MSVTQKAGETRGLEKGTIDLGLDFLKVLRFSFPVSVVGFRSLSLLPQKTYKNLPLALREINWAQLLGKSNLGLNPIFGYDLFIWAASYFLPFFVIQSIVTQVAAQLFAKQLVVSPQDEVDSLKKKD